MSTSPTLRALAHAVSGLYLDERTGRKYRREELLEAFPASILDAHARLARIADGIYSLDLLGTDAPSFRLHSRRRQPREDHDSVTARGTS